MRLRVFVLFDVIIVSAVAAVFAILFQGILFLDFRIRDSLTYYIYIYFHI